MVISIRIITDSKDLLSIERVWNLELVNSVEKPQLYSRLFCGVMRHCEAEGWTPLVFTFWSDERIVGMAPLKMRKVFFTNYVCSLAEDIYSDFGFLDKYSERCMNLLVDVIFNRLNCSSATITLDTGSSNFELLKKVCLEKKVPFKEKPDSARALFLSFSIERVFESERRK